jgi:O-antigen ligase
MNLLGLLFILLLYGSFYLWSPIRTIKHFLLFSGIVSVPFEIDYSFVYWQAHNGWTSGIAVSLSEISFGLLFLHVLVNRQAPYSSSRPVVWSMVLFLLACALSVQNSIVGKLTLYQVLSVAKWFVLYYYAFVNCLETREDLRAVISYLAIAMLLQGVFCLLQYGAGLSFYALLSTGHHEVRNMTVGDDGDYGRAAGSFPQPNGLAEYLVPLILLQTSLLFGTGERNWLRRLAILAGLFGLLASFSRGGWLGLAVCLPMLLIALGRLRPLKVIVISLVLAGLALTLEPVRLRVFGDDHNSANSRWALMHLATNMIKAHPAIGIGANTFAITKYEYVDDSIEGAWLDQVHNTYLLVFAETGFIGFACFLGFLVAFFRESRHGVAQADDPFSRAVALGIRFGLVASMLHMFVDMFMARAIFGSLFLSCGLLTALRVTDDGERDWLEEARQTGAKPMEHGAAQPMTLD